MPELTASDFDRRNNGFDIPQLDMATQTITLSGYFSFPAMSFHSCSSCRFLVCLRLHICKIFLIVNKTTQHEDPYNKLASFLHNLFTFSACFSFSHVFNKQYSFLIAVYIWSYEKQFTQSYMVGLRLPSF